METSDSLWEPLLARLPKSLKWFPRYAVESFIGTIVATTVGGLLVAGFVDTVAHRPTILDNPLNLGPVIAGLAFGLFVTLKFGFHRGSALVWLAGVLIFAVFLRDWVNEIQAHKWTAIWDNFFGPNCGATDCLDELLATAPLYSSLAYSVGAGVTHLVLTVFDRARR